LISAVGALSWMAENIGGPIYRTILKVASWTITLFREGFGKTAVRVLTGLLFAMVPGAGIILGLMEWGNSKVLSWWSDFKSGGWSGFFQSDVAIPAFDTVLNVLRVINDFLPLSEGLALFVSLALYWFWVQTVLFFFALAWRVFKILDGMKFTGAHG